jgi:hypothetical protein
MPSLIPPYLLSSFSLISTEPHHFTLLHFTSDRPLTPYLSAGFKPFMEYAGSYALFNYRLEDPKLGLSYTNLRLIRAFEHGLDPMSSEAGFVLVHVAMVKHSGALVSSAANTLKASEQKDRQSFDEALTGVVESLEKVNSVMNGISFSFSLKLRMLVLTKVKI